MQSPLAVLMGLANGAVGLIERVFTQGSRGDGFDEQLKIALAEKPQSGKALLTKLLNSKDSIDEQTMEELLASPQSLSLFQYLSLLRSFGLSSQDAKALLLGKGTEVSDDAVKAILSSCNIKEAELAKIMSNPDLVSGLKQKLAETISAAVHQQSPANISVNAQGVDALIELSTADQATFDAMALAFITNRDLLKDARMQEEGLALRAMPAEILQNASDIKKIVMAYLENLNGGVAKVMQDTTTMQENGTGLPALTQSVDAIENTFGISRKVLRDLFFAADPLARQTAIDEATSKINSFLNANTDKELSKQCLDALSLVKSSLSKEEFAPIEKAINLWHPDLMAAGTPVILDRQTFEGLARILGENPNPFLDRYTQQVMDQIKQAIPGQVKNGEGSLTLKLHPPMLGRIDVSIRMEDGALQAVFRADQSLTRDILQQNMHVLKGALAEQGIRVTQVTVSTDVLNSRTPPDAFAWTGSERGYQGSSQQGSEQGTGGAYRDPEEYGYLSPGGYPQSGGLDIFA